MRLYIHCEIRAGGRGRLCMARRTDALHASPALRNAGRGAYNQIAKVQLKLYMIFFHFHTKYTTFGVLTLIFHFIIIRS